MSEAVQKVEVSNVWRFKPYPAYKPSGVEWLGDVPEHWEVGPLRRGLLAIKDGTHGTFERVSDGVPLLSAKNIGEGLILIDENESLISIQDWSEITSNGFPRKGDVLLTIVGSVGRSAVFVADQPIAFQRSVAFLRFRARQSPYLMSYFFQSAFFQAQLRSRIKAAAQGGTYMGDVVDVPVVMPPSIEQRTITYFLDRETSKIDTLILKKRALIEKLQEKRSALISRTVTRGLTPDAACAAGLNVHRAFKPSGIDWFGEVPTHWSTSRIKYVARIESGHTPSRSVDEYWIDCTIPWVSLNDSGYLREHDYISDTFYQINDLGLANSSARLLPAGAVVFSRDATVGLCAITTRPMAVSQHFVAYLCGPKLVPKYLLFTLKAMNQHLQRLSLGATIQTIGMTDVRSLACAIPPVVEQEEIVAFLDRETERIDRMASRVEEVINRLQESE